MDKPGIEDIAVGDPVLIIPRSMHARTKPEPIPATVTKAARVWLTLTGTDGTWTREWRMRRDKQSEGTGQPYENRFVTPAQYEWEQRRAEARAILHEARIDANRAPWSDGARLLALADFVRQYDAEHPIEEKTA